MSAAQQFGQWVRAYLDVMDDPNALKALLLASIGNTRGWVQYCSVFDLAVNGLLEPADGETLACALADGRIHDRRARLVVIGQIGRFRLLHYTSLLESLAADPNEPSGIRRRSAEALAALSRTR
jgi:hypothetical protein